MTQEGSVPIGELKEWDHTNPSHLHDLYHKYKLSQSEIAELCNCTQSNISRTMSKYEIKAASGAERLNPDARWKSEEEIRKLYHKEGYSAYEVAERLGCSFSTLHYWMDKLDIELRERPLAVSKKNWRRPAYYGVDEDGYAGWSTSVGNEYEGYVSVHRLLAVAKYGIDAVKGKVVHHKNGVKWDNRPENIELMGLAEHSSYHNSGRHKTAVIEDYE